MDVREKSSSKKRLIDANEIIKEANADGAYGYVDAKQIAEALTVDAVEVVRCRECKQGEIDDPDFPDQYYCHAGCGWNKGDFYCAYGERKEGAD